MCLVTGPSIINCGITELVDACLGNQACQECIVFKVRIALQVPSKVLLLTTAHWHIATILIAWITMAILFLCRESMQNKQTFSVIGAHLPEHVTRSLLVAFYPMET